ncbi:hypothetical protein ACRYCC_06985 [Actinomadura scrupuli]|uniref:hypothetical protein n=1 Tax=Actinomadura scrupuli TaxID=559629 RepID=UPI003D954A0A
MRRVTVAVAAGLAAGTLTLVGVPSVAHAAIGRFIFHTQPGNVPLTLTDPRDNECYTLGNASGQAANATNSDAVLYAAPHCRGRSAILHLGHEMLNTRFASVRFLR